MNKIVQEIREKLPKAKHIYAAGTCEVCDGPNGYFVVITEQVWQYPNGCIEGGFICLDCGFGNAGICPEEMLREIWNYDDEQK